MDSPKVIIQKTRKYGKGVYAIEKIKRGEFITEFDGPIYTGEQYWTNDMYNHAIQFDTELWRDSKGLARYLNHSCEPNCGIKKLFKVVAMRTIYPGEEITWDYEMTEKNNYWKMKCRCQSEYCRGIIGNYENMPQSVRRRYKGFISEWLTR